MPIAPPPSFDRFDDWAEDTFVPLGSGTGATINPARRDRRGWDYLVEWDVEPIRGLPSDRQRLGRTARVQIKSSRQKKPTARLKLSNAKRFAEAVEPCFIVLFWFDKENQQIQIYARHFDEALVYNTLKRVREAYRDGETDIHHITMVFPMVDDDLHTEDLIPWLKRVCKDDPQAYAAAKTDIANSVGYEQGVYFGSMQVPVSGVDALVEHAVGLNRTFNPDWIELREARFGIPANDPVFAGRPTHFNLRVDPKPSAISFISEVGEEVTFTGEFRSFGLPGYDMSDLWASFTCPHITGRFHRDGRLDLNYRLGGADVEDLRYLHKLVILFRLLSSGVARAKLRIEDDVYDTTIITPPDQDIDPKFFEWANESLNVLSSIARRFDKPKLSIGQMAERGQPLTHFANCVSAGTATLKMKLEEGESSPPNVRSLMGFAYANVGNSVYAAIYRQPALSQELHGRELSIEFSDPIILDSWAKKGHLRDQLPPIRKRFKELLRRSGPHVITVDGGDLITGTASAKEISITT
jgi:hypothetical protein